jgi:glutamine synthetase type III
VRQLSDCDPSGVLADEPVPSDASDRALQAESEVTRAVTKILQGSESRIGHILLNFASNSSSSNWSTSDAVDSLQADLTAAVTAGQMSIDALKDAWNELVKDWEGEFEALDGTELESQLFVLAERVIVAIEVEVEREKEQHHPADCRKEGLP